MMSVRPDIRPVRRFYLLRHGESMANASRTVAGFLDTPLSPLGITQAEAIKTIISSLGERPNLVYHSALSRARDTATIVNEPLGCPAVEWPDLAEQNYGDWQGQSWDIIDPFRSEDRDPPNGETKRQFYARAVKAVLDCLDHSRSLHAAPMPLIVCHGGVFHALQDYLGLPKTGHGNCALSDIALPCATDAAGWTDIHNSAYRGK